MENAGAGGGVTNGGGGFLTRGAYALCHQMWSAERKYESYRVHLEFVDCELKVA